MRPRQKPATSQGRALEILWIIHGGPHEISRRLGVTFSVLNSWKRVTGKVPMVHVGQVSRILKVSPYLLNYLEVYEFFGKGPKWDSVVKKYKKFNHVHVQYILRGKSPEIKAKKIVLKAIPVKKYKRKAPTMNW